MQDIKNYGQVFTPMSIVSDMINLIQNDGSILEPSAGSGMFSNQLHPTNLVSIEIDKKYTRESNSICMDFFDYSVSNQFNTIIGNPPYVKFKDILPDTKAKLNMKMFDNRSNLFLFFIEKCIYHLEPHGELIFIVPRELFKATSAIKLNKFIYDSGTITNMIELGDKPIFEGACPNTVIFRFEKDNYTRLTELSKEFVLNRGQLIFTEEQYPIRFSDIFQVKVGAVSGADSIYTNSRHGNVKFVVSYTNTRGWTKPMIYGINHPVLLNHKKKLISRKIKKFNEINWWEWGRKLPSDNTGQRIYVNHKTRNKNPFFLNDCNNFDGSILAIYPKHLQTTKQLIELTELLNGVNWNELGFIVDGRFIFGQKSLENTLLPIEFREYL